LRNVLPDAIVERLKAKPGALIADSIDDAAVMFADISGFVALTRRLGANATVDMLSRLVSDFDALAVRHGVEKIKTIGDAYMVVAGLPEPVPDHTARLANMGLAMLAAVARMRDESGLNLNLRIGMASGPVTAGVIGTRKFSYDVWGDPVNLASRLEGQSSPGRILICPGCRAKLGEDFLFEARGPIEIKGIGAQETWFLLGAREATSDKDGSDAPPTPTSGLATSLPAGRSSSTTSTPAGSRAIASPRTGVAGATSACCTRSATSATGRRSRPTRVPVLGSTGP